LAAESGATLIIAHVDEYREASAALGEAALLYVDPAGFDDRRDIRNKLEQVRPANLRVAYEHRYLEGGPIHEIVAFAERERVDLIVMGSHGRTGLARLLMGSVAEGVARRAPCPVLIVKQPATDLPAAAADDSLVLQE
jgi:nucleotide-binding universal stress UspA family protein